MTTNLQAAEAKTAIQEPEYAALAAAHQEPCISIYTGNSSQPGAPAKQDLMRLKNLLRTAGPSFEGASMTLGEAEELLQSNWRALPEPQEAHPGGARELAIFMSRDFFGCCRLPSPVAGRVVIGHEFFVRPLLPLIPANDRFFVLALSQKHVKLFEGSRRGIRERTVRDIPDNFREDLEGLSFERNYEMHTASSRASGEKGAVFHGPSLQQKDRLIHYFRDVDRGIAESLKGQQAPLIVAAVEYLLPIYKAANTYPHLLEDGIPGNPDLLSPFALHAASWRIVEKHLSEAQARAFEVYSAHINSPRTSSNLRKVVASAAQGLVRFLFVPPEAEQWGSLVPPETVHVHDKPEPGDDELLNLAAILTIRHGGQVYVVPPGELPEGAGIAAVFRY